MNDDFNWCGDVEIGGRDCSGNVVVGHGDANFPIGPGVKKELGVDLLGWGRKHVQVIERTVISKTTHISVANDLLVPLLPSEQRNIRGIIKMECRLLCSRYSH